MKKVLVAAAIAASFTGAAHAAELTIYKLRNFQGPSQVVNGTVNNLEGGFAKDASSLVARDGYWEVCSQDHFKGDCRILAPGQYPSLDYILDDRIVSVRYLGNDAKLADRAMKPGTSARGDTTELVVYKQQNFQGDNQVVKGQVNVLQGGFARDASSLKVKGGFWEVCNQDHFKGDCRVLAAGEYPRLDYVLDDRISSIRFLGTDPRLAQRVVKMERGEDKAPARAENRDDRRAENRDDRRDGRDDRRDGRDDRRDGRDDRRGALTGSVELYGQPDFRGRSLKVDNAVADLGERRFEGRASSVKVHSGTWEFCTEPGFRGTCGTLRPGEYRDMANMNDRVASLRQVR